MRLSIKLMTDADKDVVLPIQYNHYLQSALYEALDRGFASFLHEEGYENSGRKFKLFTFSRLMGRYRLGKEQITFFPPLGLVISTAVDRLGQSMVNGLLKGESIRLGGNFLRVEEVDVERPLIEGDVLRANVLSPVVTYSTLLRPEGSKYTVYFQPGEGEFDRLVDVNLRNKYNALYGEEAPRGKVVVKPLKQPKLHVLNFKGTVIKGYSAPLKIKAPQPLLQVAVDAGLGSKNSMGFGCLAPRL